MQLTGVVDGWDTLLTLCSESVQAEWETFKAELHGVGIGDLILFAVRQSGAPKSTDRSRCLFFVSGNLNCRRRHTTPTWPG